MDRRPNITDLEEFKIQQGASGNATLSIGDGFGYGLGIGGHLLQASIATPFGRPQCF